MPKKKSIIEKIAEGKNEEYEKPMEIDEQKQKEIEEAKAKKLAEIDADFKAGKIKRIVKKETALWQEMDYINRFEKKISECQVFYDGLKDREYRISAFFGYKLEHLDYITKMKNGRCRKFTYTIRSKNEKLMVIKSIIFLHSKNYDELGIDFQQVSLGDLNEIINEEINKAKNNSLYYLVAVVSPIGFVQDAINYSKKFISKNLSIILIDTSTAEIFCNNLDKGAMNNIHLFEIKFENEKIKECKEKIRNLLSTKRFITVSELQKETKFDYETINKSFAELEDTNFGKTANDGKELVFIKISEYDIGIVDAKLNRKIKDRDKLNEELQLLSQEKDKLQDEIKVKKIEQEIKEKKQLLKNIETNVKSLMLKYEFVSLANGFFENKQRYEDELFKNYGKPKDKFEEKLREIIKNEDINEEEIIEYKEILEKANRIMNLKEEKG